MKYLRKFNENHILDITNQIEDLLQNTFDDWNMRPMSLHMGDEARMMVLNVNSGKSVYYNIQNIPNFSYWQIKIFCNNKNFQEITNDIISQENRLNKHNIFIEYQWNQIGDEYFGSDKIPYKHIIITLSSDVVNEKNEISKEDYLDIADDVLSSMIDKFNMDQINPKHLIGFTVIWMRALDGITNNNELVKYMISVLSLDIDIQIIYNKLTNSDKANDIYNEFLKCKLKFEKLGYQCSNINISYDSMFTECEKLLITIKKK